MSESTIAQYKYWLSKYPNLPIEDPVATYKQLLALNKSPSYVKILLCAIVWKLRSENPKNPLLETYRDYLQLVRGKQERKERDNKSHVGKIPSWEEIIKIRDALPLNRDKLILALYTYIPPRRLKDMILLRYVLNKPTDKKSNYYVATRSIMIFNIYKTAKTYNQQIIKCPSILCRMIDKYVANEGIEDGELLLGMNNYLQLNYRLKTLIGCSVDNLRHSKINNAYARYAIPPSEEMETLAEQMGHSLTTHLRYRKF